MESLRKKIELREVLLAEEENKLKVMEEKKQKILPVFLSGETILSRSIPPDKPILGEWCTEKGLIEIFAATGIGKTWLTLSIALAIAYGKNILGWKSCMQKRVLYIDGEMSPYSLQKRLKRMADGMGITLDDQFCMINGDLCDCEIPDILTEEGKKFLLDQTEDFGVIILDSLLTLSNFHKDSETMAMVALKNLLLQFRRKNKTVIFVHHEGKSGSQLGSVLKEIYLNTVMQLSRPADIDDDIACCFDISMNKARDCTRLITRTKRAELIDCKNGSVMWGYKDTDQILRDSVVKMSVELGMKPTEIHKELGITLSKVRRILNG